MFGSCWFASRFAPCLSIYICNSSTFHVWISPEKILGVDSFILQHCISVTNGNRMWVMSLPKGVAARNHGGEISKKIHLEKYNHLSCSTGDVKSTTFFFRVSVCWWLKWSFFLGAGSILARAPQFVVRLAAEWVCTRIFCLHDSLTIYRWDIFPCRYVHMCKYI